MGYLSDRKIINGYPDGTFRPNANITRLQVVHIILNDMVIDPETYDESDLAFKDIKPGSYGYKPVTAVVDLGFIIGKQNKTFDRNCSLNRGQMATVGLQGKSSNSFTDVAKGR